MKKHDLIFAGLLGALVATPALAGNTNTCLVRKYVNANYSTIAVDAEKAVAQSIALKPPYDEIEVYQEHNFECKNQFCFVNKNDRLKLFAWKAEQMGTVLHDFVVMARHDDRYSAKEAVIMRWNNSTTRPNFLKGRDSANNEYFLLLRHPDAACNSDGSKKCRHYILEIFPANYAAFDRPDTGTWVPEGDKLCKDGTPAEPGGGSGEDPPSGPG